MLSFVSMYSRMFDSNNIIPSVANVLIHSPMSSAEFGLKSVIKNTAKPSEFSESGILNIIAPKNNMIVMMPARMTETLNPDTAMNKIVASVVKIYEILIFILLFYNI